jgi:hypothetical protein
MLFFGRAGQGVACAVGMRRRVRLALCGINETFTAGEVRRLAQRAKNAAQARRLLAIAAVLDGASREKAAKIGGMDRQTLRDWVIRFNERGADGRSLRSMGWCAGGVRSKYAAV